MPGLRYIAIYYFYFRLLGVVKRRLRVDGGWTDVDQNECSARESFLKYQDRIMFGTDNGMDDAMYRNHFRWLETADEYFDYWGYPAQGRWEIYGMELPDTVLEKVYHKNAERVFEQFRGAEAGKNR